MTGTFLPSAREGEPEWRAEGRPRRDATRARKFRQAAFVYLHVALLYEYAAYAMWQAGLLPGQFGPPALWLVGGAVISGAAFAGLYWWQSVWLARILWVIHGLRLPTLISGAFLRGTEGGIAPSFYVVAIVVVVINLWMLARAAWDI